MILGLLYVGFAVENVNRSRRLFGDLLGMPGQRMEPDPYLGTDRGARIAFPNQCWLYLMESKKSESPITQHLQTQGAGLERIALLTDEIEYEFELVRQGGIPMSHDDLVETPLGTRFTVPGEYLSGVTVEIFQAAPGTWEHDAPACISGVLGLQHIGVGVRDLQATSGRFETLFELEATDLRTDQHGGEQKDVVIEPGNDRLWLHITESWGENARVRHFLDQIGEGLEHLCIEVDDIRDAVNRATGMGVPLFEDKIFTNRPDGFEAFIYPEHTFGATIELIEPYPTSRGYRVRPRPCGSG